MRFLFFSCFCLIFSLTHFPKYKHTGKVQTFTTPTTTTYIVDIYGAGGGYDSDANIGNGGTGGRVNAKKSINSGTVLNIYVGGKGPDNQKGSSTGGWNGGGGYTGTGTAGGGGGATDIRISGTNISNRQLVAGGGGGGGYSVNGAGNGGVSGSGNNGVLANGSSSSDGGGGGGGYYGGTGGKTNTYQSRGGSNYVGSGWSSIYNGGSSNRGNGSCKITYHPAL